MRKNIILLAFFIIIIYLSFFIINRYLDIKTINNIIFNNYKFKIEYTDLILINKYKNPKIRRVSNNNNYLVYLYNTHQSEEYINKSIGYQFNPPVTINNYIIKDDLNNSNIKTISEERSISDIRYKLALNYAGSYKASRVYLEDIKNKYPSLKYFIDIHRDSLSKDRTTISINNKDYASILFIVGLENSNYKDNLSFTSKINDLLNKYYPGISKGILKKSGRGVNGIYNQDFLLILF